MVKYWIFILFLMSIVHDRFETVTINAQTLECVGEISFQNPYMQVSRKSTIDNRYDYILQLHADI